MLYNLDLHIHTNASNDGSFEPKAIIKMAVNSGLRTISIADHNTCKGFLEAKKILSEAGVRNLEIIPGIEIDCSYEGTNLHLLGYGIDANMREFSELEEYMYQIELEAGLRLKLKIEDIFKIDLDLDSLVRHASNEVITGEVIAEELLSNAKYEKLEILNSYREGGNRSDNPYVNFYWDYCSQGKEVYSPLVLIDLDTAIDIINESGGIPVLAHPGNNIHENQEILQQILLRGVKGIEAISSYHDREQIDFYSEMAYKHNVLITCGSDFHGKTKPAIKMGEFDYEFNSEILHKQILKAIGDKR